MGPRAGSVGALPHSDVRPHVDDLRVDGVDGNGVLRQVDRRADVDPSRRGAQRTGGFEDMSRLAGCALVESGKRRVEDVGVGGIERQVGHESMGDGIARIEIIPGAASVHGPPQLSIPGRKRVGVARAIGGREPHSRHAAGKLDIAVYPDAIGDALAFPHLRAVGRPTCP